MTWRRFALTLVVVASLNTLATAQQNFKPLEGFREYPGYLFYYMERPTAHRIEMSLAGEGVTQFHSLRLDFPKVDGPPGLVFRELHRKDGRNFAAYEGVTFWLKGDGSDANGAVVLGYSDGPTATFPLKDTSWHRVNLKWADFQPKADPEKIGQLAFTLTKDSTRPAHFLVDDPGFARSFVTLDADDKAAKLGEPRVAKGNPLRDTFDKYVARGDAPAKVKTKLKAKQPVTIVAWGDSITNGAQLWPVGNADAQEKAIYHSLFAEMLKKKYGYDNIKRVKSAKGGYQTHQAWPNIQAEVLDHKPDLVIMAVAAGDTLYSNLAKFKENWTKIVEKLQAEGIEVILWTPTPIEFQVAKGEPFAEYVRDYAKEHKLALADGRALYLARGENALGELIPDDAHPNPRGHELLANMLFALFAD